MDVITCPCCECYLLAVYMQYPPEAIPPSVSTRHLSYCPGGELTCHMSTGGCCKHGLITIINQKFTTIIIIREMLYNYTDIILWIGLANRRWSYNVTSSPIGWAHMQNDPWDMFHNVRTHGGGCKNVNPLRAKLFKGNKNIYLHFMSFLHIDLTQVLRILPQLRAGSSYSI